jgi:hypothetical protein
MKLAEALLLRADLQKKLASLRERIAQNAVVQQGDAPHEDPAELLLQAHGVLDELEKLVFKINEANLRFKVADGRSLTEAIARRETLVAQHSLLNSAILGSKKEPDRYSMSEIKWVATMDVAKLQKQLEDLAKKIRELNVAIQEANWKAEIE